MKIGDRIKARRKELGLTQKQIAEYFGITPVSVSEWERGLGAPDQKKLERLARILRTSVSYLVAGRVSEVSHLPGAGALLESKHEIDENVVDARTRGRLPLISWVQAGNWSEIVDNFQPGDAEDWIPCPFSHGPNAFVLRVVGHSMYNPGGDRSYAPGEFIAVDPAAEPLNKRMVVVKLDGEDRATFKQLLIDPEGTMMLQALNPSYVPRIAEMPPGSRIVGVVIGKWVPE